MSEQAAEYTERRAPRSGALRRLLVLLACLAFLVALIIVPLHLVGTTALRRQTARMQQAGEPMTLQALLAARPPLPDEQNASLVIEALRQELDGLGTRDERWLDVPLFGRPLRKFSLHGPWTPFEVEQMRAYTAHHADLIARLDAIGDLHTGQYPLNVESNPVMTLLPHLQAHRAAVRLEALAACAELTDGRIDAALDRCTTMLHVGRPLMEEPFTISSLVAMACDGLAVPILETVLAGGEADPDRLRALEQTLHENQQMANLKTALRGERLIQRDSLHGANFDQMLSAEYRFPIPMSPMARASGLTVINQAKSMELMTRLIDALDDPTAALRTAQELEREVADFGPLYLPARLTMPSLARAVELSLRHRAQLAAARAALAAERYRIDRGDWPLTLDTLVPDYLDAVPTDLFDGKPLRLKRTDTGLVIYSVDRDGTDDGGDLDWTPGLKRKFGERAADIGFRLLDPAHRGIEIVEGEGDTGETGGP